MPTTTTTDTRAAELLPLLQELVNLTVQRWDVERKLEREFGTDLVFTGDIYENHISVLAADCRTPEDVQRVVKIEDAIRFTEDLAKQKRRRR